MYIYAKDKKETLRMFISTANAVIIAVSCRHKHPISLVCAAVYVLCI